MVTLIWFLQLMTVMTAITIYSQQSKSSKRVLEMMNESNLVNADQNGNSDSFFLVCKQDPCN